MAIVSSGQISLLDIQTEFGGSPAININKFYAGGTLVPAGTLNVNNAAIPSSGQIAFSDFYGSRQKPASFPVSVLVVGGGGGGGPRWGNDYGNTNAGAGGGGMVAASFNLPKGTYSFTVGGGGYNGNGADTVAFGYTAYGGGRGGGCDDQPGSGGGCGGGGAQNGGSGAGSTQPKPTSGDYGSMPAYGNSGTGGGGAGGGTGGNASGGSGGSGRSWINGTTYAKGGNSSAANGGYSVDATFYGDGGGGGNQGTNHGPQRGSYGYQGIVIISYQWPTQIMSGGSVSNDGGTGYSKRWYHSITSSAQQLVYS
jgi:hypothetical protein